MVELRDNTRDPELTLIHAEGPDIRADRRRLDASKAGAHVAGRRRLPGAGRPGRLDVPGVDGARVHRVIGALLRSRQEASHEALLSAVRSVVGNGSDAWARSAFIVTAARVYLDTYLPRSPWQFVDAEVRLRRSIADFVFDAEVQGHRQFQIEELKTSLYRRSLATAETRNQLSRLLEDGLDRWGPNFAGVRLVAPALRLQHVILTPVDLISLEETLRCP